MGIEKVAWLIESMCDEDIVFDAAEAMFSKAVESLTNERTWHEDHERWDKADEMTEKIEALLRSWEEYCS